jgi:peptide/nickel transport system substrate-binding protein
VAKWLTNRDFRRAMALGIDRDQLNESIWLGIGTPGSCSPADETAFCPGKEYRKKWGVLDLKQANSMLDTIGLAKKDSEGFRLRTDGKGRLRIEIMTVGGQFLPFTQVAEMVKQHWKKIGLDSDVKETERSLAFTKTANAEHHILVWSPTGGENIFLFPRHVLPVDPAECHLGMPFAKWYATNGAKGKKPTNPEMLRAFELFRSAAGKKEAERIKIGKEIWRILVEECWIIGTVGLSPAFMGVRVAKNNMGNLPSRQINAQHTRTPNTSQPSTFYFKA